MKKYGRENEKDNKFNIARGLAMITQVGLSMLFPILIGLFIGVQIDKWLGSAPIGLAIMLVIGVLSAFRNLFMLSKKFK